MIDEIVTALKNSEFDCSEWGLCAQEELAHEIYNALRPTPKRQIIQIAYGNNSIMALCDDSTIWGLDSQDDKLRWVMLNTKVLTEFEIPSETVEQIGAESSLSNEAGVG